jgi:hypothetical protein
MLGIRRPSAPDTYVGGPMFKSSSAKKNSHIHSATGSAVAPARLPLYRTSRRPSSLPSRHAPPRPHRRSGLTARGRTTRLLLSPPLRAPRAPYRRGPHNRLPCCHPPSPPRPHSRDPIVPCFACLTAMFC